MCPQICESVPPPRSHKGKQNSFDKGSHRWPGRGIKGHLQQMQKLIWLALASPNVFCLSFYILGKGSKTFSSALQFYKFYKSKHKYDKYISCRQARERLEWRSTACLQFLTKCFGWFINEIRIFVYMLTLTKCAIMVSVSNYISLIAQYEIIR